MDLADLIVEKAKRMEHEERSRDYFVLRCTHHTFESDLPDEETGFSRLRNVEYKFDFEVHPSPRVVGSLVFKHKTMRWAMSVGAPTVKTVFYRWLGQTFRDTMEKSSSTSLTDHAVTLEVFHGSPDETGPVFKDKMNLFDPIEEFHVADHELNCEITFPNSYDQLVDFKKWCLGYLEACVNHEFLVWDDS